VQPVEVFIYKIRCKDQPNWDEGNCENHNNTHQNTIPKKIRFDLWIETCLE